MQGEREAPAAPEGPSLARDGQVWEAHERNIGAITPLVAEPLGDDERVSGVLRRVLGRAGAGLASPFRAE